MSNSAFVSLMFYLGDEARPLDSMSENSKNSKEDDYEWVPKEELEKNKDLSFEKRENRRGVQYLYQREKYHNLNIHQPGIINLIYTQVLLVCHKIWL